MLSEITNETLVKIKVKAKNWEEAIRQSASVLVENNKVTEGYVDAMINSAKASECIHSNYKTCCTSTC